MKVGTRSAFGYIFVTFVTVPKNSVPVHALPLAAPPWMRARPCYGAAICPALHIMESCKPVG